MSKASALLLLAATILLAGCAARSAAGEADALTLEGRQWAYDRGYGDGLARGQSDLENGLAFDPRHDSAYEKGDAGYRRSFRNRESYREVYRQAYESGYKRGYYGYR